MTVWVPKGEFPHWEENIEQQDSWRGNVLAFKTHIRQENVIHFENLYRYMYHYVTDEGWKHADGSRHIEHFYGEKRDQENAKELRAWWRAEKQCGGIFGPHSFLKYKLYVDFLCYHLTRIEITYGGKKIKPYVGDVNIWITTVLEIDYNNWQEVSSLMGLFYEYFIRRIYKRNIRDHEVELRRFAARFASDIKYFINMTRDSELRLPMHLEKQWF
ncbi:hypothetical protein JW930_02940 [Candidatus Woesearchaeota archaeon]|nr:hypothetical protein [Candidatus Woesearchaeota archaeon]